jgi:hypothetical protein
VSLEHALVGLLEFCHQPGNRTRGARQ